MKDGQNEFYYLVKAEIHTHTQIMREKTKNESCGKSRQVSGAHWAVVARKTSKSGFKNVKAATCTICVCVRVCVQWTEFIDADCGEEEQVKEEEG